MIWFGQEPRRAETTTTVSPPPGHSALWTSERPVQQVPFEAKSRKPLAPSPLGRCQALALATPARTLR